MASKSPLPGDSWHFWCKELEVSKGSNQKHLPNHSMYAGWWFQPIWKICSSTWIISPGSGENSKCLKPPPSMVSFTRWFTLTFFIPSLEVTIPTFPKGHVNSLTIPKRSNSQNCQVPTFTIEMNQMYANYIPQQLHVNRYLPTWKPINFSQKMLVNIPVPWRLHLGYQSKFKA